MNAPGFSASYYLRFIFHIVLLICIGFFIHIWRTKNYWYTQIPINPTNYYQSRKPGHRDENYRDRNRPSWRTLKFWSNTPIPDISVTTNEKYKLPNTVGEFYQKFKKLIPFIWPCGRENLSLQILIILCVIILIIGRVVNVFVPIQYKRIINSFAGDDTPASVPYKDIFLFVFLKFLQSGVGLLNSLQNFMWIPVGQYTTREISISMFKHLHSLSLRFHLHRKTGEILRVQDRGVSSIITLLSSILFNILPTLVDITVACAYFTLMFDATFGIIVFMTMALFIITTIIITEWRNKYRRWTNLLDNAMEAKAVDSLLNFETVKYYNAEDFEADQYCDAIDEYQKAALKSNITSTLLNLIQNVIIQTGLLVGCFICALRIMRLEGMTVGDFVLYLSYITQLYGPLNWFGNYYRAIQKNFVDMEKMIDLFQEPVEVQDKPDAIVLEKNKEAEVEFKNVFFSYDPRLPALKDITFTIKPGSTVALVGPSGSGKSTILRLLFRFYDVDGGSILINGQDIRNVTQKSLRSNIGVVSQDTMLFNDTIRYNIRYGRCDATDEEVEEAAKLAQVHDKIMAMPDGYDTKVGERGLRLSGGEKQRIAIARTFLKNSSIILLDEATSALDTRTERHIQQAISEMTRDRTVLVIAHRLSTIIGADLILVVKDGKIVERGSHQELLNLSGEYYKMWQQQLRNENARLKKKGNLKKKNKESTSVKKRGGISGLAFGSGAFVGIGMGLDTGMSNIEKTPYEKEDIQSERDESIQEDFNSKTGSETENDSECNLTVDDSENNYSTNMEDQD
ncbi:P-loop containing nucleoside triphosphate hydrolase protein [Piromyces finnis]|uniref:p-loop containing nucleoside triphosphate hydrolase protein n=1 Tax=Piromyces finnis TaxID=1754191 RepID=A0A1Y1V1H6_9FUNG|nr:P-loop containing nucleoside triphosphate hydrolase protein [Piromyces finnis]|eukprot:ORX44552.1 P-loop containing nucleoside triphosphate hydrolase protein [Piromyces finnis]